MKNNIPECMASNTNDLLIKIKLIIENQNYKKQCSDKCLALAKKNHLSIVVNKQFLNVVNSLI
jgi:hypothetical protein